MAEQDTARTIIFDLVQLERLGAELERRFLADPKTQATDVLGQIEPDDYGLYLPQLERLLDGLRERLAQGTLEPNPAQLHATMEVGEDLRRSLMATALLEESDVPPSGTGSKPPSGSGGSSSAGGAGNSSSALKVPDRIDQFRILSELGSGAFGVVYLAEDESLQRKVAIKVPKVVDARRSESYINEARKAAAIDCKGIVPIYHVGTKENGVPFVVQKLIDGPSLRVILNRYGSLPPAHAVTLLRDITTALGAAHRLGIYHRDLKPDNILLDGNGVPWIADFGLAISEAEQAQRKGEIAGTLMYMSPEQIQGRADWLDGRSDIWALGIMLYELLIGKPPFSGKNRQSLMEQICHRQPRPLQQSSPLLANLNDVFQKCCAKSPSERYSSAEELAEILSTLIEEGLPTHNIDGSELQIEQPISQYPTGTQSRMRSGAGSTIGQSGASATQLASHRSSQATGGPSSQRVSQQDATTVTSANYQTEVVASALSTAPAAPSKPLDNWLRGTMIAVGLLVLAGFGLNHWKQAPAQVAKQEPAPPGPQQLDPKQLEPGQLDPTQLEPGQLTPGPVQVEPAMPKQEPLAPAMASANALTKDQADGSAEKPYVVAVDGSGSHRTLAAAFEAIAKEGGSFVTVRPGVYEEALQITRSVNLSGSGEPDECTIVSQQQAPVTIACDLGTVRLANLSLRGNGRLASKEFNTIELTSGKLRLENCWLRASTFNCVKVRPGSSLVAERCRFEESNQFAVTSNSHLSMEVIDCDFFSSGIQTIEGAAAIKQCRFRGEEGVYVEGRTESPTMVSDCQFEECVDYGVTAVELGDVTIADCRFDRCAKGVLLGRGTARLSRCELTQCKTGIELVEGSVVVNDQSKISDGGIGLAINGGSAQLDSVAMSNFSGDGVIAIALDQLRLVNTTVRKCNQFGIHLAAGTLQMEGGVVQECGDVGLVLDGSFIKGEITGTKFSDSLTAAILLDSGELSCTDVSATSSEVVLLVAEPTGPVRASMRRVTVNEIGQSVAMLNGDTILTVRESDFSVVPEATRFVTLGGAKVETK